MSRFIQVVEVGPRDGLQNEKANLHVDQRLEFIRRLEAAGVRRTETVSFVNPERVPQMAGAEAIQGALPRADGHSRIGLVLNERGWDRCVAAACDEANVVVCASDEFGIRNQGATTDEQVATLVRIANRRRVEGGPPVSASISLAFGCPFSGEVPEERVVRIAKAATDARVDEIALADTIGCGDPWMVRKRIEAVRKVVGDIPLRVHFHDTRNTGLANSFAAIEAGVDVVDASCGGLGGCPFAPAATGNIATEDLVYMLERAGFSTGIDLDAMIETGRWASGLLGKPPASALSRAGVFPVKVTAVAAA